MRAVLGTPCRYLSFLTEVANLPETASVPSLGLSNKGEDEFHNEERTETVISDSRLLLNFCCFNEI